MSEDLDVEDSRRKLPLPLFLFLLALLVGVPALIRAWYVTSGDTVFVALLTGGWVTTWLVVAVVASRRDR